MNSTNWMNDLPSSAAKYIVRNEEENCRWGRLIAPWNEILQDGKVRKHVVAFGLNLENGDIYLDCSKRKILAKMLMHTAIRPIYTVLKFGWHALIPISIPVVIYKTIKDNAKNTTGEIAKLCLHNSLRSLADIVRTPAYGIAMTVVSIVTLAFALLNPNDLYEGRCLIGRLECSEQWGSKGSGLMECFQPYAHITDFKKQYNRREADTDYAPTAVGREDRLQNLQTVSIPKTFDIWLSNWARKVVRLRKKGMPLVRLFLLAEKEAEWGKIRSNATFLSPTYELIKQYRKENPTILPAITPEIAYTNSYIYA